jgi:AhpD family alkylhydroperoxidase
MKSELISTMHAPQVPRLAHLSYESFQSTAPAALAALQALGKAVDETGFDKGLRELVKLRVSQINGCAFCTQFHLDIALRLGVDALKLDLVAVWRDAGVFSAPEEAALAWAEHLTVMASDVVPEDAYARLREQFSEAETIHLTVAIATINAWNRVAGGLRFPPAISREG